MLFDVIPSGWRATTLGGICQESGGDIQTGPFGSQLHASDYVETGIPSIMPANIKDGRISEEGIARITPSDAERLSRYLVRGGDIVYSRRGDVERCALVRHHQTGWLCGTGCLRVRPGSGVIESDFCAHFLSHPETREWISRHAIGATMPNLNTQILSAVPVLLPPSTEQKAIAHILGTLDDKIELNRKTNETLEAMARALFQSWFVDFDPVRAKAEGRPTGLPDEISDLFPDSFEESELGEIPKGWEVRPLGDMIELAYGKPLKGTSKNPNPHCTCQNIE
jgi:type I restriction enzyme S subunit